MANNIINVLMGINSSNTADKFKKAFKANLEGADGLTVGKVELAHDKELMDKAVSGGEFDVFVCKESVDGITYGCGSVEKWQRLNPNIRIILVMAEGKKGGKGLYRMYTNGYYDAMYNKDFTDNELFSQLILHGRSREDAFDYYGVANNTDYQNDMLRREMEQEEEEDDDSVLPNYDDEFPRTPSYRQNEVGVSPVAEAEPAEKEQYMEESADMNASLQEDLMALLEDESSNMDNSIDDEEFEDEEDEPDEEQNMKGYKKDASVNSVVAPEKKESKPRAGKKKASKNEIQPLAAGTVDVVATSSVVAHEGYIIAPVSDRALLIEFPDAHFLSNKEAIAGMHVTLISARILDLEEKK